MLITKGMPFCSATWAMAAAAPESNGPTSTFAPSWISRSARLRAVSTLVSVSAFISSMSTPSICLMIPGAMSAPNWQDWPMKAWVPDRGSSTPTLSLFACALAARISDPLETMAAVAPRPATKRLRPTSWTCAATPARSSRSLSLMETPFGSIRLRGYCAFFRRALEADRQCVGMMKELAAAMPVGQRAVIVLIRV